MKLIFDIINKWKRNDYLKDLPEKVSIPLSIILDSQQLFLNTVNYEEDKKKLILDVTAKVFSDCVIFDMVSVWPLLGPIGPVEYLQFQYNGKDLDCPFEEIENKEITLTSKSQDILAGTKKFSAYFDDLSLADKLRNEICREVIGDLKNNIGTHITKVKTLDFDSVYASLVEASNIIHKKTLRGGATFVVVGNRLGKLLADGSGLSFSEVDGVCSVGTINRRFNLIVDSLFADDQILCGYKGNVGKYQFSKKDSGYFYCPYVFLSLVESLRDGNDNLYTRYGKRLISAKNYGLLSFVDGDKV